MEQLILSQLNHTWIFDIDGTICKHNGYKIDNEDTILPNVKKFFDSLPKEDFVIILTSRSKKFKKETVSFLKKEKIRFNHIIFDCPVGERIIVNDNKPSGLVMSRAVCLERDKGLSFEVVLDSKL